MTRRLIVFLLILTALVFGASWGSGPSFAPDDQDDSSLVEDWPL